MPVSSPATPRPKRKGPTIASRERRLAYLLLLPTTLILLTIAVSDLAFGTTKQRRGGSKEERRRVEEATSEHVDLPVMLYNFPELTGKRIDLPTVVRGDVNPVAGLNAATKRIAVTAWGD